MHLRDSLSNPGKPLARLFKALEDADQMTLGVVYIEEGESALVKVPVSESGVSEGLALGAPVSLPWMRC